MDGEVRELWRLSLWGWLAAVCVMALVQSGVCIGALQGWLTGDIGNVGLMVLAREGMMVYGFAWSCLMMAGWQSGEQASGWGCLLWNMSVAVGVVWVLSGCGSGNPMMPFPEWIAGLVTILSVAELIRLAKRGGDLTVVVAGGVIVGGMAVCWVSPLGEFPPMGQYEAHQMLRMAVVIGAAIGAGHMVLREAKGLLAWLPMVGVVAWMGDWGLWSMPGRQGICGIPGSAFVLLSASVLTVLLVAVCRGSNRGWILLDMVAWIIVAGGLLGFASGAADLQLSPLKWYGTDCLLLVLWGGAMTLVAKRPASRAFTIGGVLLYTCVMVFACVALVPGTYDGEHDRLTALGLTLVSGGVAVVSLSLLIAVAMECCAREKVGQPVLGHVEKEAFPGNPFEKLKNVAWRYVLLAVGGMAIPVWWAGGLAEKEGSDGIVVRRPGADRVGARLYAAEGCGMCHTQVVRRTWDGGDLQKSFNENGNGSGLARVSEAEDWDSEAGEGMAHIGWVRLGPDLFQLGAKAERLVRFRTSTGEEEVAARPEEWLMAHLYNPRDPRFGKVYSLCPSLANWFVPVPTENHNKMWALPTASSEDCQLQANEDLKHLIAYLRTLKRGTLTHCKLKNDGTLQVVPAAELNLRDYVDRRYAENPPKIDTSIRDQALNEALMLKGKQLYASKCALCHGADGRGDDVNYPPLLDSEWVKGDPATMARIVRNGATGRMQVLGKWWDETMLAPGVGTPEEAASVMTYVRRTLGGLEQDTVSAADVQRYWTASPDEPFRASLDD